LEFVICYLDFILSFMSDKFKKLVDFLTKLPGIGPRQATRLAMAMLEWSTADLEGLSSLIANIKKEITHCKECFNLAEGEKCAICASVKRDKTRIAVVEKVTDLESIEKIGVFNGVYHVLGGAINPAEGALPEKLKIAELIERIKKLQKLTPDIEIILATNPNTAGETTALYIEEELKPLKVKVTRLARGLSAGASLEYADEITISQALKNRK
jgi:recombination protein RecR